VHCSDIVSIVAQRCEAMMGGPRSNEAASFLQCINSLHGDMLAGKSVGREAAIESLGNVGCIKSEIILRNSIIQLVRQLGSSPFLASLAYNQVRCPSPLSMDITDSKCRSLALRVCANARHSSCSIHTWTNSASTSSAT
jgi:hypothetical protein